MASMDFGRFQALARGLSKRERTRAALLDAAVAVIAVKGMEAAKISDITTAAGMANGTFYNHFKDKDEILRETAVRVAAEIGRELDEEMSGVENAVTRVVRGTLGFVHLLLAEPEWAAVLMDGAGQLSEVRKDMMQYLRGDLERGLAQGKFDIEVSQFLLDQVASLIAVAIRKQLVTKKDLGVTRQVCESVLRLLGLSPSKARKAVATAMQEAS